uniref:DUF2921 domain-containing protein n=1 Tax=Aegilops tauschii TaxID=37682 RepID=M8B895_AEGTA
MAPAPGRIPSLHMYHLCLCFLLLASTVTLSAAVMASSYSSVCPSLTHAHDRHTDGDTAISLIRSFQISTGHFFGGSNISLFPPDDDPYTSHPFSFFPHGASLTDDPAIISTGHFFGGSNISLFPPDDDPYTSHPFSFFPHGASLTDDPAIVHLTATFTLTGPHSWVRRRRRYHTTAPVSSVLDGYHSSASPELCMVGTGTGRVVNGSLTHDHDVALHLHVPRRPNLTETFVFGSLEGSSGLGTIRLLAYTEADDYKYGSEHAACSPSSPGHQPARGSLRALGGFTSTCAHLKEQLMISYRLEHGRALFPGMRVDQTQCVADDAVVRAYAVLSNDTGQPRGAAVDAASLLGRRRWWPMGSGTRLSACSAFGRAHAVAVDETEQGLLNASYGIRYSAPPDNWVRPTNMCNYSNYSVGIEKRKIPAEGVYDPNRGKWLDGLADTGNSAFSPGSGTGLKGRD